MIRRQQTSSIRYVSPWHVGFVAGVLGVVLALRLLIPSGFDPSVMLAIGVERQAIPEFAAAELGTVTTRPGLGHDGAFFFVQAFDPLLTDPDTARDLLDKPVYRAQRVGYPALAGLGGLLPSIGIAWGMIAVNILGLAFGSVALGRLATRYGVTSLWGLAFALNLGLISDLFIGGAGILAFATAVWGVERLARGREGEAAAWFAVSVLTRETMLVFVAGVILMYLIQHGRVPWLLGGLPFGSALVWGLYVRLRLPPDVLGSDAFAALPGAGILDAFTSGRADPIDHVVRVTLLVLMVLVAFQIQRRPIYLGAGAAGFLVLALFLSEVVWLDYFDITRALAPVLTFFVFAIGIGSRGLAGGASVEGVDRLRG